MYTLNMSLKMRKPTELREKLFETLEQSTLGETFLIPHKGGASILQNETDYLEKLEEIETLKSINRGLQDAIDGKTFTHADMKKHMQSYGKKSKK